MSRYGFQTMHAPGYGYAKLNLKLIAGILAGVIVLSLFAGLAAAHDGVNDGDEETGASVSAGVEVAASEAATGGIQADANARAEARQTTRQEAVQRVREANQRSREALDPDRAMRNFGQFRSKLAHYVKEQCVESKGVDKMRCFDRVLKSELPAELRNATEAIEPMHQRRAEAFKEFAKRTENQLMAHACLNSLEVEELKSAYAEVQSEVEPKLIEFATGHAREIAAMEVGVKVELEVRSGNNSITVPKAVLARHVLAALPSDSQLAAKCVDAAKSRKEAVEQRFKTAKDGFKEKMRELKETRREATEIQKNERLASAITALIEARIKAAEKFETHGASSEATAAFVASMQVKKTEFLNASFEQRKEMVRAINQEWKSYVHSAVSSLVSQKITEHALKLKAALAKVQGSVEELKASGKDVSQLEQLSLEANAAIEATQEQNLTMREAMHRAVAARAKLKRLAKAVNAVLNNRDVPSLEVDATEEAAAQAAPDVVVNVEVAADAEAG